MKDREFNVMLKILEELQKQTDILGKIESNTGSYT